MRLIDSDKLCNDLMDRWSIADKEKDDLIRSLMADVVTPIVVSQPTVDAVPVVHGRWKVVTEDMVTYKRICSCCGKEAPYDMRDEDPLSEGYYMLYPYCPMCGAKMDGRDGDGNG